MYEIKSSLILQPGPAALTNGLAELQRINQQGSAAAWMLSAATNGYCVSSADNRVCIDSPLEATGFEPSVPADGSSFWKHSDNVELVVANAGPSIRNTPESPKQSTRPSVGPALTHAIAGHRLLSSSTIALAIGIKPDGDER